MKTVRRVKESIESRGNRMKRLIIFSLLLLAGCGSSTVTTKITITERPDSLVIKGDSIAFTAKSDSLLVDSVEVGQASLPDRSGRPETIVPPSPKAPVYLYRSVHAKKDTTIGRWKLRFGYTYPPDRWSVEILEADTMARWKVRDSLIEKPYEVEVVPLWIKLVIGVLGAALILSLVKR